jgi:hypothetical protein
MGHTVLLLPFFSWRFWHITQHVFGIHCQTFYTKDVFHGDKETQISEIFASKSTPGLFKVDSMTNWE